MSDRFSLILNVGTLGDSKPGRSKSSAEEIDVAANGGEQLHEDGQNGVASSVESRWQGSCLVAVSHS